MSRRTVRTALLWCLWAAPLLASGCDVTAILKQAGVGEQAEPAADPATAGQAVVTPASGHRAPEAGQALPIAAAGNDPAADMYGDQGGEPVAAAITSNAPMRSRKDDSFYRLSNVRTEASRFGWPALKVDYERIRDGKHAGASMILRDGAGNTESVMLMGPFWDKSGTIEVEQRFPTFGNEAFPKNLEVYLTRGDARYGKDSPTFKVSNSATMGQIAQPTLARAWTAREADRLRKPPPNYANANAHPNVGQDTEFIGGTGGVGMRYVDPQLPMIGIEYRLGEWDGEKCLGQIVPVFSRDQPGVLEPRVIAKDGYAVGGMKVHAQKFVDGVQLVFMKAGADGKLNPDDRYESEWIGYQLDGEPQLLGGDGRRAIGLHARQAGVVDAVALVLERK